MAGSAEAMGADMTNGWEQWEGRTVDGKFVLERYLGGSDGSAVFRMRAGTAAPKGAAIKFVAVDGADAENQLLRWKIASEFSHPNVIRLLAHGRCAIEDREFVYVVEEFAEENLGQVVPERALTAEEARVMLKPVLAAVEFVHGKGLVYGRIRPSSIFAVSDQVKLSSDSLLQPGGVPGTNSVFDAPELTAIGASPAGDMWSLGMTLVDVMTQHTPGWDAARMTAPVVAENVPEPFRTIARRCLEMDPEKRCGVAEIRERLEPSAVQQMTALRELVANGAVVPAEKPISAWLYWLAGVVVIGIVALLLLWRHPTGAVFPTAQSSMTQNAPVETSPEQSSRPSRAEEKPGGGTAAAQSNAPKDDIVERARPDVAASARQTIQGRIKVQVRVNVDADGNVTEARLKDAGPSKYFARVAEEAAKRWKFVPAPGQAQETRVWTLLFVFTRAGTEMSAARER